MSESRRRERREHKPNESLLLIPLPELDDYIAPWRSKDAPQGVGAHVTVLAPFMPQPSVDEAVLAELRGFFAGRRVFALDFARTGRFPGFLYLAAEPDELLRALIDAVSGRWPQYPPYAGKYTDLTPHLSVVYDRDDEFCEAARRELERGLPVHARVEAVHLLFWDRYRWQTRARFPLGGSRSAR